MIIVIILGIISAKSVYSLTENMDKKNNYYFLQLGVYNDLDTLSHDTKNVDEKLVVKDDGNYYVYVGISKNKNILKRLSNFYKNFGYNLIIKNKKVASEEFKINLEQFDKLLNDSKSDEELKKVMAVILSSYQEIVLNSII
jgi:hypothetical protein